MSIEVGSRVIVNTAELENEHGTVVEILKGQTSSTKVFEVVLDSGESIWTRDQFLEEEPVITEMGQEYELKIDFADNVVVAILYKNGREIGRGHGHILHSGKLGYAQAISFACRRMYQEMGGTFNGQ